MRTRDEQIEKMVDVMRNYRLLHTKEEDNEPVGYPLIDALTYDGGTVDIGVEECGELAAELYDSVIASFILEAERRAEQRVRAEIGRDSERLDYLGTLGQCCVEYDSLGEWTVWKHTGPSTDPINMGESVCSIRSAIDAAREVG